MGVRGDVWKVKKSGSHWGGAGAGQHVAFDPVQAQSGQWWEVSHGGQS